MSEIYEDRPGGGLGVTDAGAYDDDGYAGDYGPPGAVPPGVPFAVPFPVPSDGPEAFPWGVPPRQGEEPLGVGEWGTAPDDDGTGQAAADRERIARLAGFTRHRVFGGGPGGLAAELRDPRPGTWADHRRHISAHPLMPQGQWRSLAFTVAHWVYTGHMKATGKALTVIGSGMVHAGKRVDWAGDRAMRVTAFYAGILILIFLITAFIVR